MATTSAPLTEADILGQVIAPTTADLSPEAARALLSFSFDRPTTTRIRQLLRRNNRGTITADERIALEKYLRVGQFLDLLHAKAKSSLKGSATPR